MRFIDRTIVADERDPNSEGLVVAKQFEVNRAPFFVVDQENGEEPTVYTIYMKFVKEVLEKQVST